MNNEFKEIVRQVKEQVNIVDVIGRTVSLKKAGASYKGLCPFHKEKTPSFNVRPSRGIFHCFGCGVGGTVIDFVMRSERLEFIEALEKLAAEIGLELPKGNWRERSMPSDEEQQLRRSILDANAAALNFFRDALAKGRNPLANDYLPERGITPELVEKFQIGAAMDDWDALRKHLNQRGFTDSLLVEAGLCVRSERGSVYDRFRNRLIFPIHDVNGKPVGFGGRALEKDAKGAKYINSPETAVYKKSQVLYALNLAQQEITQTGYAILCEGYMDVVIAHACGFPQAVANLGTALTSQQARLLKRFTSKVFFLYDGDSAGQSAMLKGGPSLLENDFDVRTLSLPPEDDPDSYLRREGHDALKAQMDKAREFLDFAIQVHSAQVDLNTLAGQAEFVERMGPTLIAIRNEVMREGAIGRVQRLLGGLPREALLRILDRKRREAQSGPSSRPAEDEGPGELNFGLAAGAPMLDSIERGLLKVMLESGDALDWVRHHLNPDWIVDERLSPWIFHFTDSQDFASTLMDEAEAAEGFSGDRAILTGILAWEMPVGKNPALTADELLRRLHERHQLRLTQFLMGMIEQKDISEEDRLRLLKAFHHENRTRIQESGRFLRTKDYEARRARRPPGSHSN